MKLGENIIAESGTAPFFRVSNPEAVGLTAPEPRSGDAVRTWVRSLSGFQKEAIVISARSGIMWRLVSDEGAYLNGHDAAPCPLAFFTVGMISSFANEIMALAAERGIALDGLRITQNNYYTMKGSMRKRTMTGGALPVELEVEAATAAGEDALRSLVIEAVGASPVSGMVRGVLPSLFTLTRDGEQIAPGRARPLDGPVQRPPEGAAPAASETDLVLIERLGKSPVKAVEKGTSKPASSLTDEQDRILNPAAILTIRDDGMKEIEQHLYSPHGSIFRFLSDEAPSNGGQGRAPDALAYVSAGLGFCFMTQFRRMASMEDLELPSSQIVQDTHFSLGGATGGTGEAGRADPVETHVHLETDESDDVARDMLDVSEQTCFLHALCRTDLRTRVRVRRA